MTDNRIQCKKCIGDTQRMCKRCGGGYCLTHNEGSNMVACDCKAPSTSLLWPFRAPVNLGVPTGCAGSSRRFTQDLY